MPARTLAHAALFALVIGLCDFSTAVASEEESATDSADSTAAKTDAITSEINITDIPYGLGERTVPESSPLTAARAELGRTLFFDKLLSADGTVSCATCHKPDHGFATSDPVAIGINGRKGQRNAPSLFNRTFGRSQFWDGRATSLEEQAVLPIENPDEMGHSFAKLLPDLRERKELVVAFTNAFATNSDAKPSADFITKQNIGKALSAFQRTLLLGNSPVDRFRNGDVPALTPMERTGMWLFESRGKCWKCHSGHNFTDEKFHNTGVSFGSKDRDTGRFAATQKPSDRFKFKTPTLRGVGLTAPYMHDGSIKTLEEVVRFYSKGGAPPDPLLDSAVEKLDLSDREIEQLVLFLKALSRTSAPEPSDTKKGAPAGKKEAPNAKKETPGAEH